MSAGDWRHTLLAVDLIVLYLAAILAVVGAPLISPAPGPVGLALCFPPLVTMMMRARPGSDERLNASMLDSLAHVLGVVSLAAMLTVSADATFGGTHPLALATRLWVFALVDLSIARIVLLTLRRQAVRTGAFATPTLIVGAGVIGAHLVKRLSDEPAYGLRPVAFLDSDPLPVPAGMPDTMVPVLGGVDDLTTAIASTGARHVILAFSAERDHTLVAKVRQCEALGVGVSLIPRLYEAINERTTLDHVGGLPLLTLHSTDPLGWQFAVKHAIDRTAAAAALVSLAPLMLAIAVAVRASSPGPIMFRQRRVGRDGKGFDVLKFRTMYVAETDGMAFVLPDGLAPGGVEGSDRRTPVGRILRHLSLDELPQLINVLKGDMSIVGPRPERPEFVAQFARDVARYDDRHRVKSGITGWAQVHGLRGQTSIADRVEWDNYYIQNWSLRLDARIMALTLGEMLRLRGR